MAGSGRRSPRAAIRKWPDGPKPMANGRNPGRKRDTRRDPGGFVAIPWSVLDSPAYFELWHPAKALLMELARQCKPGNNGRLLLSSRYLRSRGWKSPRVIGQAKRELLQGGFIHETVKGGFPDKASWYAVTWRAIDRHDGYDAGALASFERGTYRRAVLNTALVPRRPYVSTAVVIEGALADTKAVATRGDSDHSPATTVVHHLDVPSQGHQVEGRDVEVEPAKVENLSGVQTEKANSRANPSTCQHAGCRTLALGHAFCGKHQAIAPALAVNG
jgi:hypothetical protein